MFINKKITILFLVILLFGLLISLRFLCDTSHINKQNSSSKKIKLSVPDFTLKNTKGKEITLSDYKGKVIVLHFWTTWCEHCIQEMPIINEINEEYKDKNFVLLAICPYFGDTSYVKEFAKFKKYTLNALIDEDAIVSKESYKIDAYPTTYILDKNGKLSFKTDQAVDKEYLQREINKLKP